ncbi:MAG: HAD-IIIA family hydrolase [Flavobacteriales bacterium]|nr:HAD-IIIA family hydrolase [Flavobacteriales bacterium]
MNSENTVIRKLQKIRALVTDVDGVLTNGAVYYSAQGEMLKRFYIRDGMGFERLRLAGYPVVVVTGENSEVVHRRMEKLQVEHYFPGVRDKLSLLLDWSRRHGFEMRELAYLGDDVNDISAMQQCGLKACPADAFHQIRSISDYICHRPGGHGAFREVAELLLAHGPLRI